MPLVAGIDGACRLSTSLTRARSSSSTLVAPSSAARSCLRYGSYTSTVKSNGCSNSITRRPDHRRADAAHRPPVVADAGVPLHRRLGLGERPRDPDHVLAGEQDRGQGELRHRQGVGVGGAGDQQLTLPGPVPVQFVGQHRSHRTGGMDDAAPACWQPFQRGRVEDRCTPQPVIANSRSSGASRQSRITRSGSSSTSSVSRRSRSVSEEISSFQSGIHREHGPGRHRFSPCSDTSALGRLRDHGRAPHWTGPPRHRPPRRGGRITIAQQRNLDPYRERWVIDPPAPTGDSSEPSDATPPFEPSGLFGRAGPLIVEIGPGAGEALPGGGGATSGRQPAGLRGPPALAGPAGQAAGRRRSHQRPAGRGRRSRRHPAAAARGVDRRAVALLPRPLAQGPPPQATDPGAGLRRPGREPDHPGRDLEAGHRLAGLRRADA